MKQKPDKPSLLLLHFFFFALQTPVDSWGCAFVKEVFRYEKLEFEERALERATVRLARAAGETAGLRGVSLKPDEKDGMPEEEFDRLQKLAKEIGIEVIA